MCTALRTVSGGAPMLESPQGGVTGGVGSVLRRRRAVKSGSCSKCRNQAVTLFDPALTASVPTNFVNRYGSESHVHAGDSASSMTWVLAGGIRIMIPFGA